LSIPKIIHYCWFGGSEKPQTVLDCIESWKKHMPDYEIREWNNDNFFIEITDYTYQANKQKKWAFVSDYARLWALYNLGGIYMDTDVEVFKPFDDFLHHKAFTGFENVGYPVTAVMGAIKGNPIIKEMLAYYDYKKFEWLGYGNTPTNTVIMSDILGKYVDRWKNEYQETENITIYPKNYFCPNWWGNSITDESYARHLMLGSWGE
jgi:mannosyltransferase OCH1-like enzyme